MRTSIHWLGYAILCVLSIGGVHGLPFAVEGSEPAPAPPAAVSESSDAAGTPSADAPEAKPAETPADKPAEKDKPTENKIDAPADKPATESSAASSQSKGTTENTAEVSTAASATGSTNGATGKRQVTVVSLGLRGELSEAVAPAGLFGELQRNLRQTIESLDRAAADKDVSAVVLKIRNPTLGRGKLHEIRQAVTRLRRAGKRVDADLQFAAPADYLLACACDRIVMPESGMLFLPGVRAELTFFKDLFDKLGLQADMLQMGEFKGAAEPYTRTSMSESFRRQYDLVVDDLYDQMVDTIATDRQLSREKVEQAIDRGLLSPKSAAELGLIDLVAYEDDHRRNLSEALSADSLKILRNYGRKQVDTDFSGMVGFVKLMEMMTGSQSKARTSRQKKIAVVYAVGIITSGESQAGLLGDQLMGSDTIVSALQTAEQDETVAAIVLRIDSPGGSALASDLVWRQIQGCKKPVVASMGDIAASGGYYIAMGCDRILAEPGTLTGSIGVVGGKIAMSGLMQKLGVTTDVISRGKNSGIFASMDAFTESERQVFRESMEEVYRQFTTKAAAGRKMELSQLESLAGGRIWTGRQAQQKGLVDELGTLQDAVQAARQLAGVPSETKTEWMVLPKPRSLFEQLFETPDAEVQLPAAWQSLIPVAPAQLREAAQAYQLLQEPILLWWPYMVKIH